jgi:hypothetical protein
MMVNKINLFRKTDTTLVYIASDEFAKEIMGEGYHCRNKLFIHVGRDKGSITVYVDNDINKVVQLNMKERQYILKCAEDDR